MITKDEFESILNNKLHGILILDGALATELESRGHVLNGAVWSAQTLREDPGAIKQVHQDYFEAGADVAITASYQASIQGLTEHCGMSVQESLDLIKLSVKLAQQAREDAYASGRVPRQRKLLVAGSVGPYGAYLADGSEYRGDYVRSPGEFKDFHRPRIAALIEAGVDMLALETMPSLPEIDALLSLLRDEFPGAMVWLSCTVKGADQLSDGTLLSIVSETVNRHRDQVVALGVNCIPLDIVTGALPTLGSSWQGPLVCYPNSGEVYDSKTHSWSGDRSHKQLAEHASEWSTSGARLIGGCCRTGPENIRQLAEMWR